MKPVKVWDLAVRLTHLAMGVLVLGAFLTAEEDDTLPLHMKLGLGLLGIVLFRVVWGFVGSTHARFSDFVKGSTLEVRDSGPGIPASEREQVFERFFRSSVARGTSGSGLGLSVVRAIAEAEGATVSIDTAPEGGACIRVRFAS